MRFIQALLRRVFGQRRDPDQPGSPRETHVPPRKAHLESLESRTLLAGDFTNAPIDDSQMATLLTGLDGFAEYGRQLSETGALAEPLALVALADGRSPSAGQLLNVGDAIDQRLATPIRTYLEGLAAGDRNTDGLVSFLETLPEVTAVTGGLGTDPTDELRFEVTFHHVVQTDDPGLDFGAQGDALGVDSSGAAPGLAALTTALDLTFSFGVDLNSELSSEAAFFLRDAELGVSTDLHGASQSFEMRVGILGVNATATQMSLDHDVSVTLNDLVPDAFGNVTLSDLNTFSAAELSNVTVPLDDLSATFSVSASLGSWSSGAAEILVAEPAPGSTDPVVTTTGDFAELLNFNHLDVEGLLAGLDLFGVWLTGFGDSSVLDIPIPFARGTLGNQFPGSDDYLATVAALQGVDGVPTFSTIQEFAELPYADVDYDPATNELTFPLAMNFAARNQNVALTLRGGVAELGAFETAARARLRSSGTLAMDLNVDLSSSNQAPEVQFSVDQLRLTGRVSQGASAISGSAHYGIVGVDFSGGTYAGLSTFSATIGHPNSAATEVPLGRLIEGLATPDLLLDAPLTLAGNTRLTLPGVTVQDGLFTTPLPVGATITARVPNFNNPTATTLALTSAGQLGDFADLSWDYVTGTLATGVTSALGWAQTGFEALETVGMAVSDLVESDLIETVTEAIADGVDAYEAATGEVARLQDLVTIFADHVPSLIDDTLQVVADVTVDSVLRVGVEIVQESSARVLDLGLSIAKLAELTGETTLDVGEFGGSDAAIDAEVSASLNLDFEVDLTVPSVPQAYLSETSELTASLLVLAPGSGQPLEISGSLGVLSVSLTNGSISISGGDPTLPDDPATFTVGLANTGRVSLSDLDQASLETSATGEMELTYEVTVEPSASQGTLHFRLDDLGDPPTIELLEAPDFEQLIADITDLNANLQAFPGAFDELLGALESALQLEVFGLDFPLIGGSLDGPANFVRDLRADLMGSLNGLTSFTMEDVRRALARIVRTQLGGTVSLNARNLEDIRFTINLSAVPITWSGQVNTDLGLPALGASLDGELEAIGSYDFRLTVGVSLEHGVYIDTSNEMIGVDLDVNALGSLTGRLGFLEVTADVTGTCPTDGGGVAAFHAGYTVGLHDEDSDNKLTLGELATGFIDQPSVEGCAGVEIDVSAGSPIVFMPSIVTTISIDWPFSHGDLKGGLPTVTYDGVGINLGDFLSRNIGPLIAGIDDMLDGMAPVLDILADEFPVVGAFLPPEANSLVEVASTVFPFLEPVEVIIEIADMIADIAGMIEIEVVDESNTVITFGNLKFGTWIDDDSQTVEFDARDPNVAFDLDVQVDLVAPGLIDRLMGELSDFSDSDFVFHATSHGAEFSFALFEQPIGLFEFLLGLGDAEIFTFTLPGVDVAVPIGFDAMPIIPPVLNAGIYGSLQTFFELTIGFDTAGFRRYGESGNLEDLLLGFYLSDTAAPDGSGEDVDQFSIAGTAVAGIGSSVLNSTGAYVGGGLTADLSVDLLDHDGDGKVRGDEFISQEGCLHLQGSLAATLEAGITVLGKQYVLPFATKTLGNFNEIVHCSLPTLPVLPEANLARLTNGELHLFVGDEADQRDLRPEVIDEVFAVTLDEGDPGTPDDDLILVAALGGVEQFAASAVDSIHADAGDGEDWITIGPDVNKPAHLLGGLGNDRLTGGADRDTLEGGSGDDVLDGGDKGDTLDGGAGNDTIEGGAGRDSITGGLGNDDLSGGDETEVGFGDTIDGGSGNDTVNGNGGDDVILTGDGLNVAYGDDGNDTITGGSGVDTLNGGNGDDSIQGLAADDVLVGGIGNDTLVGGTENDLIDGEDGNDTILGETGNDTLFGGAGNDSILGHSGVDYIDGEAGLDTLRGNAGNDTIYGGSDADTINGDQGNDLLYGDDGGDTVNGDDGRDTIDGGNHNDTLKGGTGNDLVLGAAGVDSIEGGAGNDDLDGGTGNDTIRGYDGNNTATSTCVATSDRDTIHGGAQRDRITGDCGDDLIFGDDDVDNIQGNDGADTIEGGAHNDVISGDAGADDIEGGTGNDNISGGSQSDTIRGGSGNDTIRGQGDPDLLYGGSGHDTIDGGTHSDTIDGGDGDDHLLGQADPDLIFGDTGHDTIEGHAGADSLRGNSGEDLMYGDGGEDDLEGGPDNDTLRGGEDNDTARGGDGDDLILGHTGDDSIFGDEGDDVLYGYLGGDTLTGGLGNDRALGQLGDDHLVGEDGDDILEGGSGDDTVEGGNGNDALYGEGGVDEIRGGVGDDFLHAGDGIGNQLHGESGNDHLVGSDEGSNDPNLNDTILFGDILNGNGGDDLIEGLGGADLIHGGIGTNTLIGGAHNDRVLGGSDSTDPAVGSLSDGADTAGPWAELSGSASDGGLTQVGGFEESVFAAEGGVYVVWVDWRTGDSDIYLAFHPQDGGDWTMYDGSAMDGGISDDDVQSRRPTVVEIENYHPVTQKVEKELLVAWTSIDSAGVSTIEVARLDQITGAGWVRLANPGQTGTADHAQLVPYSDESALLGWLDTPTGLSHVNVAQYIYYPACANGTTGFGIGVDATDVMRPTADVTAYDLTAVEFRAALAASYGDVGDHAIDVGVASGAEVLLGCTNDPNISARVLGGGWLLAGTFTDGSAIEPTVAMRFIRERSQGQNEVKIETDIYVAWHEITDREDNVMAKVSRWGFNGGPQAWEDMQPRYFHDDSARVTGGNISDTFGYAAKPALAASTQQIFLTWMDDSVHGNGDGRSSVFVMSALGASRILEERLEGDASDRGISPTGGALQTLSISTEPDAEDGAHPYIAWTDYYHLEPITNATRFGAPQVLLRHDVEVAPAYVQVRQTGGSTNVAEGSLSDTYSIVLLTAPTTTVRIRFTPDDQLSVGVAFIDFTPTNWYTPQVVTVTAVDDLLVEGAHTGLVSHRVTSTDARFNGLLLAPITVGITDNDRAKRTRNLR